ncbi:MAG: hypothetical protein GX144_09100 [Clostridiaceae bacterium]|jgi:hypothetical protein|nr:hypothetical protein [Clostridiaceae bacterium]
MDENVSKMLSIISITFLIVIAISLFFVLYWNSLDTITLINHSINDQGTVYEVSGENVQYTDVRGGDIAGCIKNGLETDILIDSHVVLCTQDANSFDFSLIDKSAWYSVQYFFNDSGEVTSVQYRKR